MTLPQLISVSGGNLQGVMPVQTGGSANAGAVVALNAAGFVDPTMLTMNIDGGDARAKFLASQIFDGGNSASVYGVATYADIVLSDSPVAYWPLNETSGTVAHDLSGNSLNGTIESGVTIDQSQGIPGAPGSFFFNGSSGYIDVPASSLLCPLNQGSVEAWVYSQTSSSISGDWVSTGQNQGYRVRAENGYADIVYGGVDQLKASSALPSSFAHVVITFGPNGAQIY
ncbi:MAG: LamG-like jellyroll fold domain-containing protein, partial [Thiomonas sp.]